MNIIKLIVAIVMVESGGDPNAVGKNEELGVAQITPIMVQDVNRILGYDKYDLNDRLGIVSSCEMMRIYWDHYCEEGNWEQMARCWNQGKQGYLNNPSASDYYWFKVQRVLNAK